IGRGAGRGKGEEFGGGGFFKKKKNKDRTWRPQQGETYCKSARNGQLRPCVYRTAEGNQRCFRSFGAGVRGLRKARTLGSRCLVIDFRHCGRDRDDSRAPVGEMRWES